MIDLAFWLPVALGGLLSGGSSGLLGVYIVGMRIPFLAVCVAHAGLAGAIFGALAGLAADRLILPALAAAVLTALALGRVADRGPAGDPNVALGVLFSLSMGLAFLGLGLFPVLGRSDHDARALLWGSLALCRWRDVGYMAAIATALAVFVLALRKELRALLFSREHATAAGVRVGVVWTCFLVLAAIALTVNFQTVGGLMIYSLVTNPAVAAVLLVRGHGRVVLASVGLGAGVSFSGFLIAALTDLPSGATIVLLSSALVAAAAAWRRSRTTEYSATEPR